MDKEKRICFKCNEITKQTMEHENLDDFLEGQVRERNVLYHGGGPDGIVGDNQFFGDFYNHAKEYANGFDNDSGVVTGFIYKTEDVFHFGNKEFSELQNVYKKLTSTELKNFYSKSIKNGTFNTAQDSYNISDKQIIPLVKKLLKSDDNLEDMDVSKDFLVPLFQKYAKSKGKNIISFEGHDFGGSTEYVVSDIKKLTNLNDIWKKAKQSIQVN